MNPDGNVCFAEMAAGRMGRVNLVRRAYLPFVVRPWWHRSPRLRALPTRRSTPRGGLWRPAFAVRRLPGVRLFMQSSAFRIWNPNHETMRHTQPSRAPETDLRTVEG